MTPAGRPAGGMLYVQIATALLLGMGALLLGLLAPPANGLGWLVLAIGGVLTLTALAGTAYAVMRSRGSRRQ